jgi:hypothetical protein
VTKTGVHVFNVAKSLLQNILSDTPPFKIFEIDGVKDGR